ncbi:MAG: hypothetical protein FWE24_09175 [Defluviitaleaceae bacterium]|nr:hypothetical protein [Defluviitaleaceae bacterium]
MDKSIERSATKISTVMGLNTDEFNREIERTVRDNKEFMNTLSDAADSANASVNDLVLSTENIQGAFDGLNISEIFSAIIEKLRQMVEYFSKIKEALMEISSKGIALRDIFKGAFEGLKMLGSLESVKKGIEVLKEFGTRVVYIGKAITAFTKTHLIAFGAKLAALKPALIAFGVKLKAAFPFLAIGTLITAFGTALAWLWNNNDEFRDKVIGAWEALRNGVTGILGGVVTFFTETMPNAFRAVLDFVQDNWKSLIVFIINPISGIISLLYNINPEFREWADNLIAGIKDSFRAMAQIGRDVVVGLVNGIKEKIDWAKETIAGFFGGITSRVRGLFGINSPSRVFAGIGKNLGEGLVDGIESMEGRVDKTMAGVMDALVKSAEGADLERSLSYQLQMFSDTYDRVKAIIIAAFEAISRKAQEIVRRMTISIDEFLRSAGFQTGRNFFGALGDGLIAEEGRLQYFSLSRKAALKLCVEPSHSFKTRVRTSFRYLMSEAMRVADGISGVFNARNRDWDLARNFGMSPEAFAAVANDFVRLPHDESGVNLGGDTIINQYFYGVKEEQTAFQAYRAAQRAVMMDVR